MFGWLWKKRLLQKASPPEEPELETPVTSEPEPEPIRIPGPGPEFDQSKGLFVIGSARSGTTVACKVLNLSPEVYLLEEANFYSSGDDPQFCSHFNQRHLQWGSHRGKATYVPLFSGRDHTAWELLKFLAQHYRYVGEKVAMGPWIDWDGPLLEFHAAHFFFSQYVLTVRRPDETVWSMWKKFRKDGDPIWHYLRCWLAAFRVVAEFCSTFPNTRIVLHERISRESMEHLARLLGLKVKIFPKVVLPIQAQASAIPDTALKEAKLPEPLQPLHPWLKEAHFFYHGLQLVINEDFSYAGEYAPGIWFRDLVRKTKAIEDRLVEHFQAQSTENAKAA